MPWSFVLGKNNFSLTDQNLEHLSDFLNQIVANSTQNQQIPDGAHIFHGSADKKIMIDLST